MFSIFAFSLYFPPFHVFLSYQWAKAKKAAFDLILKSPNGSIRNPPCGSEGYFPGRATWRIQYLLTATKRHYLGRYDMATPPAESRSNRAAVQATNDDASASKLYATSLLLVFLFVCTNLRQIWYCYSRVSSSVFDQFLVWLWIFEHR